MRRNATTVRKIFPAIALIGLLLLLPYKSIAGQNDKKDVVVRVRDSSQSQAIARRHGLRITKTVTRGSGDGMFVVSGTTANAVATVLASESAVVSVDDNIVVSLADDNGETVLPLDDNGETVLPLGLVVMPLDDNGETVLPLDDNGETVLPLDDNGETVLPLELRNIKTFYNQMAKTLVPSEHLLIQTSFINIGLYDLYAASLKPTGKGIIVADLDTGADSCHPALAGVFQLNFVNDNGVPNQELAPENCATASTVHVPGFGHGTAVGSLIRIVAPQAQLWSLRVFDNTATAQVSDIYEAIVYAVDHGANVINMSFGTPTDSPTLQDAMHYAYSHGVVLIAAGGNTGTEGLTYPANYSPMVEGVVAVDSTDIKAAFSSYGQNADLSAPGVSLWVAYPNFMLSRASGTSYAAPLAAGEAALLLDAYSRTHKITESQPGVVNAINSGVDNINNFNPAYAGKLGGGRIDIPAAVSNNRAN